MANLRFSSSEIETKYQKILDNKIDEYSADGKEISSLQDSDFDPEMVQEILSYCRGNNNLDTIESRVLKRSIELDIPSKLLYIDSDGNIKPIYDKLSVFDLVSISDIRKTYQDMNPRLTLDEFIEGLVWESEESPDDIKQFLRGKVDLSDLSREDWDAKRQDWQEDDTSYLEEIILRQFNLLVNSVQPDIQNNYAKRLFNIQYRELSFKVQDSPLSMAKSIHDKFIDSEPTSDVPFIRLGLTQDKEVYKIYTDVDRSQINTWISKDERVEDDTPFPNEDYIYFLIKNDDQFIECFLSESKCITKIPSSFGFEVIQTQLQSIILDTFVVEIYDPREINVELETTLESFPHIEPTLLQFYLVNNQNTSLYIDELSRSVVSNQSRKIRVFYKPVSEGFSSNYLIEYVRKNSSQLIFKGPTEQDAINFFVQVFGRMIHGFFIRQTAINFLFQKVLYGDDHVLIINEPKKDKKKKPSTVQDPHMISYKEKIKYIKSLIDVDTTYSKFLACERQPLILTKEEAEAWINTKFTVFNKNKGSEKYVKSYKLLDGKVLFFTCPDPEQNKIYLTKKPGKNDPVDYTLHPSCFKDGWITDVTPEEIVLFKPIKSKDSEISRIKNFDIDNIDESTDKQTDYLFLSQEVKHLLGYFLGDIDPDLNLVNASNQLTNNSFLESVLYGSSTNIMVSEVRSRIASEISPFVLAQEATGINKSPEDLIADLQNPKIFLDSKLFLRALEEYFKMHIFIFTIHNPDLKFWNLESNFGLEIASHKIFSSRVLYRDRPCMILIRHGTRYNTVTYENKSIFSPDMSAKLMELFYYTHEVSAKYNSDSITKNMFSRINWEILFKDDPIIAQEIDISGKTRIIKLKSEMCLVIPPTQPLNVPLIESYHRISPDLAISKFGEPHTWDSDGFWYDLFGIPNLFYVITNTHPRGIPENISDIPLNIFQSQKYNLDEIFDYTNIKRFTHTLIQILQWAWRVDRRPLFRGWLSKYLIVIPEPENLLEIIPEYPRISLPTAPISVTQGFQEIHTWWYQIFTADGRIRLWEPLLDTIYQFFDREQTIMLRSNIDPIPKKLVGLYTSSEDYISSFNVRIFIGSDSFNQWAKVDRKREENPVLQINNIFNQKSVQDLYSKEVPSRVFYKNHWITVINTKNKTFEEAVGNIQKDQKIIILGISKRFNIVEVKSMGNIGEPVYILKYPNNSFAAILN